MACCSARSTFSIGFIPGIKAFTAAVLGGIGNIPGAMLGGLFLGQHRVDRADALPRRPRRPVGQPAQGRDRLHHARAGPRLPAVGHPRRARLEDPGMSAAHDRSPLPCAGATAPRRAGAWRSSSSGSASSAGVIAHLPVPRRHRPGLRRAAAHRGRHHARARRRCSSTLAAARLRRRAGRRHRLAPPGHRRRRASRALITGARS